MSNPYDDFIQRMPLAELARFVEDLARQYGVTDAEIEQWRRMSHAERMQWMREQAEKMRRRDEKGDPDA